MMADVWRVARGFLCLAGIAAGWATGDHSWWLCSSLFGVAGCFDAMPPRERQRAMSKAKGH